MIESQRAISHPFNQHIKRGSRSKSVDNLVAHVNTLATYKGRAVSTAGHREAKEYILNQLLLTHLSPYTGDSFEIPYVSDGQAFTNILGIIEGQNREFAP